MHDSFEKEVQKKMEGLNLSPSAPVWQKIELQIRPEKRRRWFFIWLLLPVAMAGAETWWLTSGSESEKENISTGQTHSGKTTPDIPSASDHSPVTACAATTAIITAKPVEHNLTADKKTTAPATTNKIITAAISNKEKQPARLFSGQPNKDSAIIEMGLPVKEKNIPQEIHLNKPQKNSDLVNAKGEQPVSKGVMQTEKKLPLAVDSLEKKIKKEPLPLPTKTDSTAAKIKVARQGSKWSRHLTIRTGWTNDAGGYNNGSAPFQYNSAGSNPGTGPVATNPSKTIPGLFFSLGYGIKKIIGKKLQLGIGLQYSYYSVSNQVGSLQTSGTTVSFNAIAIRVDQYYTNTNTAKHSYTTKFGVVELPVQLQYQPLKRLPLAVSAGASYGRLLNSNALTYDYSSGTYYFNKANNRRNFLNLYSALQYRFQTKGRLKIETGPLVQYHLLRMQNDDKYGAHHLFAAGLKTDIFF